MGIHTFLIAPDSWHTDGDYFDGEGEPVKATGSIKIVHLPDHWLVLSRLGLEDGPQFEKEIEIEVIAGSACLSRWQATDNIMGKIFGIYILLDDTILSWYHSADRSYHGYEFLKQMDPNRYEAAGAVFKDQTQTGRWKSQLTRVQ